MTIHLPSQKNVLKIYYKRYTMLGAHYHEEHDQ